MQSRQTYSHIHDTWHFRFKTGQQGRKAYKAHFTTFRTLKSPAACKAADRVDVLVIGSGGREHALAWKLRQSPRADAVYCTPGNAGVALEQGIQVVTTLDVSDHGQVADWCLKQDIGLVVVGPEAPLVAGLCDDLRAAGIRTFGPSKAAAQLEGSKAFLKVNPNAVKMSTGNSGLCERHSIPTAAYSRFADPDAAKQYVKDRGVPIVVKADGLAAGKGVYVAKTEAEALKAVDDLLVKKVFGSAGSSIVVEEFLDGEEVSYFAIIDGETCLSLASAQDHKAVGEGDVGPNTGGMGAYSPAPAMTSSIEKQVVQEIIQRTALGLVKEGTPFQGVLFAGLMIKDGQAKLLEHNVRFGDPECECLMMRLQSDLLELLLAATSGDLQSQQPQWSPDTALTVILAAKGYPGSYSKGTLISGLQHLEPAKAFHCGTGLNPEGQLVATGGRVLALTATGSSTAEAQSKAYKVFRKLIVCLLWIKWSGQKDFAGETLDGGLSDWLAHVYQSGHVSSHELDVIFQFCK